MGKILKYSIITVVASCKLQIEITPDVFCQQFGCIEKNRSMRNFIWRHKSIYGTALLFYNGYISVHGCKNVKLAKKSLRQFARLLQNRGYHPIISGGIKINTMSAKSHMNMRINLHKLCQMDRYIDYEPEIFSAAIMSRNGMKVLIYSSGAIIISGLRHTRKHVEMVFEIIKYIQDMVTL